ncbi:hypothetical protein COU18_01035 [Candidatus Kaiserbacteria bacterium CG10_big_fil_rev_8_21_14_0_10_51_14]|uniref:Disulfide bond formation protein B n=1 Tax=Candidatus Kaiserbacteria bacterium CG10_big_fil_rev_8_21_14_0_10_51_14 TaxID=1974610 RepID=A0A2H0UE71_9BACT|nr:MAG: hypothetical protein COU18_01035 [Candidatus Kaiserbacteria bacterium CG10_big_fil_rev_8_21_14_0_10_51_14]
MPVEIFNTTLAFGTLALQIGAAALFAVFLFRNQLPSLEWKRALLAKWGLWIALALTLAASALTLFYSEVVGFPPCPLCWWQRVFLYPQVVLFALALWKHDRNVTLYSIALSVLGLGFALYHHALQVLPSGTLPCPAEGAVSCAQRFIFEFGYITFPLMSASLFAFLIVLMLFVRRR